MNNDLLRAIRRLNYQIDKIRGTELHTDIAGVLEINFENYITKSGRISKTLAKSDEPELLERINAVTEYVKQTISDYENIPENIYDIWQSVINEYYRWVSEFGAETVAELAPMTTDNIDSLRKNDSSKTDFFHAVERWRAEREKLLEYADEMRNAEPFTDTEWTI